jgi:hypothetical protein
MKDLSLCRFKNLQENLKIELIANISEADYGELFANEKSFFNYLSISNLYRVSKLNSDELLQSILDLEKRLIENKVLIMNDDSEKLNTNRHLLNYLFSFRTYIDHLETFIKREYGKQSNEVKEFKALTANIHDKNLAYRFFYNLRNYSQHCGLPIDIFEIQPSISDNIYSVKLKIEFDGKKLLENFDDWRFVEKDLIENDTLDLVNITKSFTVIIKGIDAWFYNLISPSIELVKTKIKVLTNDRFENTLNLCVTYNNEQDKLCAVDSVFRYITQIEKNYH